jgi:glutathione S-transferase
MELLRFVDLETARVARGLRLVVSGVIASPWSEAAKGIFHVKQIPALGVHFTRDNPEFAAWTGARNVPVVLYDEEPPLTGWAEILALAERLGGARPLVPTEPEKRVRLHGLAHELAGAGGLGWCQRLVMIHGGLVTDGARGFPVRVSQYLAPKYGYAPERVAAARDHVVEVLRLFDGQLAASRAAGHRYLLGDELTALDIYLATFLTPLAGQAQVECPQLRPDLLPAFAYLHEELGGQVPPALLAHRSFVYREHLVWPIPL